MSLPFANATILPGPADYFRFLLDLRALLRCFFPGGPPSLPRGVLALPGFFFAPITSAYGSGVGFRRASELKTTRIGSSASPALMDSSLDAPVGEASNFDTSM